MEIRTLRYFLAVAREENMLSYNGSLFAREGEYPHGNGTSYSRIIAVAPGTTLEYVASARYL